MGLRVTKYATAVMIENISVRVSLQCLPMVILDPRDDRSQFPSSSISCSASPTWADQLECDEVRGEGEGVEEEEDAEDKREAGKRVAAALARSWNSSC